jgi:hypothetical protein
MFYGTEWENIIGDGEFSETVALLFNSVQYPVKVTKGNGWNRKKPDGQLTTDKPLNIKSIVISKSAIPSVIDNTKYNDIQFIIDDTVFSINFYTGTDVMRFYLKASDEVVDDIVEEEAVPTEEDPVDPDDGLMEV